MTTIFTIGHGTRSTEELAEALTAAGVRLLVDVRRFPGSRRNPQFAREVLERSLPALGVEYDWRGEELGGRRSAPTDHVSRHVAWRTNAFRAYADYMDTDDFRTALDRLRSDAARTSAAVMCAETLWWKCHRRLISDALVIAGEEVVHIHDATTRDTHELSEWARADEEGKIVYDVGVPGELPL